MKIMFSLLCVSLVLYHDVIMQQQNNLFPLQKSRIEPQKGLIHYNIFLLWIVGLKVQGLYKHVLGHRFGGRV